METMRTLGADAVAVQRVPAAAGHRDAAPAHAAALRVGAGGRAASRRASARSSGSTIRCCRATATTRWRSATCRTARAASSPSACKGGADGRRALHRGGAVPVASRQRRRREDAGDPSGVDDASPARRGGAARGRRHAGDDPPVDRTRNARRYPLGHRSGAGASRNHDRERVTPRSPGPGSACCSASRCSARNTCCVARRRPIAPLTAYRIARDGGRRRRRSR